jgi:phage tail sheath gpL-like
MVEKYLLGDPNGALYVLPMADAGGGVAATGKLSFTGPATAAGSLSLYIAGNLVTVAVTAAMTAASWPPPPSPPSMPGSAPMAWLAAGQRRGRWRQCLRGRSDRPQQGHPGQRIDLRLNYYGALSSEAVPAGITVAITAMANGATDPDITGLDAILGDENYDFIAVPWSTATQLNALQTLMANRRPLVLQPQDYGHVWAAKQDADATGATNIAFGLTRNDPHLTCVSYEPAPTAPWLVASAFMAAAANSLRADPARPLQTLTVEGIWPLPRAAATPGRPRTPSCRAAWLS